jgi:hypothetical protein
MRAAFCTVLILLGLLTASYAGDDAAQQDQRWKKIKIPQLELNGYTARFGVDEQQTWQTPDPSGRSDFRQDSSQPVFGLTFSRPLKY